MRHSKLFIFAMCVLIIGVLVMIAGNLDPKILVVGTLITVTGAFSLFADILMGAIGHAFRDRSDDW